jgi:hypothetical protein
MSKPRAGCQRCIAKEAIKSPAGSEPGWLSNAYVAYWLPVNLRAAAAPKAMKSQPTGLYGLREATIAPTVAKGTAVERTRGMRAPSLTGHSRNPRPIVAMIRAHRGQASQVAARKSIPLAPRACSLAPYITITTLQGYRLPNVTTTVTRRKIRRELQRTTHVRSSKNSPSELRNVLGTRCLYGRRQRDLRESSS